MSTAGLFVAGTLVTLLVTASMALLIWGAVTAWRDGLIRYSITDAAMRQLLHEGWMPGRARLFAVSFPRAARLPGVARRPRRATRGRRRPSGGRSHVGRGRA